MLKSSIGFTARQADMHTHAHEKADGAPGNISQFDVPYPEDPNGPEQALLTYFCLGTNVDIICAHGSLTIQSCLVSLATLMVLLHTGRSEGVPLPFVGLLPLLHPPFGGGISRVDILPLPLVPLVTLIPGLGH